MGPLDSGSRERSKDASLRSRRAHGDDSGSLVLKLNAPQGQSPSRLLRAARTAGPIRKRRRKSIADSPREGALRDVRTFEPGRTSRPGNRRDLDRDRTRAAATGGAEGELFSANLIPDLQGKYGEVRQSGPRRGRPSRGSSADPVRWTGIP